MSRPILSLCMIVRDEQEMLPGLLDSVAGLWDQLCVVDTGSGDRTVELLREAGAEVQQIPWRDDFAAARNASLAMARGEWILSLDADERVTPELARAIRAVLDDPAAGAATLRLVDDLPGGRRRTTRLLRLFRNDQSIRYRHRIHEDVAPAVTAFLERTGLQMRHLPGTLIHLGYRRDVAAARRKKERDLALLREAVSEDRRDWYSWYKMLELARFWDDRDLWRETTARVLAELRAAGPAALEDFAFAADLVVLLGQGCCETPAEELAFLDGWRDALVGAPEYRFRRGLVREMLGDLDGARRDYEACRRLPAPPQAELATVRPLVGLARVTAAAGDWTGGLALAEQALDGNPVDPEALLAAVTFADRTGQRERFVADYAARHGRTPELLVALGEHDLETGRWQSAHVLLEEAVEEGAPLRAAEMLAQARLALADVDGARDLAAAVMDEHPPAALGVLTCDLVAGRDLALDVAIDADTADRALREWLTVLWRSRHTDLMAAFVERMGLVTEYFPWLEEFLRGQTEALRKRTPQHP